MEGGTSGAHVRRAVGHNSHSNRPGGAGRPAGLAGKQAAGSTARGKGTRLGSTSKGTQCVQVLLAYQKEHRLGGRARQLHTPCQTRGGRRQRSAAWHSGRGPRRRGAKGERRKIAWHCRRAGYRQRIGAPLTDGWWGGIMCHSGGWLGWREHAGRSLSWGGEAMGEAGRHGKKECQHWPARKRGEPARACGSAAHERPGWPQC